MRRRLFHHLIAASALGVVIASVVDSSAPGAGLGKPCGGRLCIRCDRGLFCDFPGGTCDRFDADGTCVRVPRFCARRITWRSVCGCNGKTYRNNCQRQQAVISMRHEGRC